MIRNVNEKMTSIKKDNASRGVRLFEKVSWTDTKRLFLFLGLSFVLTGIFFIPYIVSGHHFGSDGGNSGMDQFVCLGMLCPMLAMLLTRWISHEGFALTGEGSMMLGIDFKKKKWIFYLIAMFLPWIYFEAGNALILLIAPEAYSGLNADFLELVDHRVENVIFIPFIMIVSGMFSSFAALGEEAGWRGYMMPKMIKMWGTKKAILIGGIIWGAWHWPITIAGHNFGMDYFGYPYTGMIMMCILCISVGVILTFLTMKSGSIWPAVILHSVNNTSPGILQFFMEKKQITGWLGDSIVLFLISFVPMILIAVVIGILLVSGRGNRMCKENKQEM